MAYLDLQNDSPGQALRQAARDTIMLTTPARPDRWLWAGNAALAMTALALVGGLLAVLWIKLENFPAALLIATLLLLPLASTLSHTRA